MDFNNGCATGYFYNQYRNYCSFRYYRIFYILVVCSACAHACDKRYMVCGGDIKTMVTKDDILTARDIAKKTLKAQAIIDTKKYLEGDFPNFLNETLVQNGKSAAILAIARGEKYDTVFFTPVSEMYSICPPLYDLEYFLQELRNNGFEVTEDKCYTRADQENIIIKI